MWKAVLAQAVTETAPHIAYHSHGIVHHLAYHTSRIVRLVVDSSLGVFRVARRILVSWSEQEGEEPAMRPAIVIASYDDGCTVQIEVNHSPFIRRQFFFTNEQLCLWNPAKKKPAPRVA